MKLIGTLLFIAGGFLAGWLLRPVFLASDGESRGGSAFGVPPGVRPEAAAGYGSAKDAETTRESPTLAPQAQARPFEKGGAEKWLRSLGEMDDLDQELERLEMIQTLAHLDLDDVAELHAALVMVAGEKDNPQSMRTAMRMLFLNFNRWSQLDPRGAFEAAMTVPPEFFYGELALLVFGRMSAVELETAMNSLERIPENARKSAGRGIMDQVGRSDPFAAIELIPRLGKYASSDPRGIVDNAVAIDAQRTAEMAGPISGDAPLDNTFLRAMEKWLEKDATAAEGWLAKYNGPGKTTGITALLSFKLKSDPQGVAEEFLHLQNPEQSPYSRRLVENIQKALEKSGPPERTLEWAVKIPAAEMQGPAVGRTVSQWAEKDAEAASQWVNAQPSGQVRDFAALGLIQRIWKTDTPAAWEWARSLSNEPQRANILGELFREWRKSDANAAQSAFEGLPVDLKDAVLQPGSRPD